MTTNIHVTSGIPQTNDITIINKQSVQVQYSYNCY